LPDALRCSFSVRLGEFMGQVLQFCRRHEGFDAEATAVLIAAYESAIAEIARSGQPQDLCEVAARRIIAMVDGRAQSAPIVRGRARDGNTIRPASVRGADKALPASHPGRCRQELAGLRAPEARPDLPPRAGMCIAGRDLTTNSASPCQ
jgi:hypothetical protein